MPTCSATSLRSQHLKTCLWDACSLSTRSKESCRGLPNPRLSSSAAAVAPRPRPSTTGNHPAPTARTPLTTVHYTTAFLRRVLPSKERENVRETDSLEFWENMLGKAQDGLSVPTTGMGAARIVVYGVGECSGARELVDALLEEPFAPEYAKTHIRERWKSLDSSNSLLLRYGTVTRDAEGTNILSVRSSWLQQFPIPVEIQELPSRTPTPTHTHVLPQQKITSLHAVPLFSADIPIIVCNPLTTNLSTLFSDTSIPWTHTNAILVITSSSTVPVPPLLEQQLWARAPSTLKVLFVDPVRALLALQTLGEDSNSASSVQRYQDGFSESRVSSVSAAIAQQLEAMNNPSTGPNGVFDRLRKQNVLDLVSDSLHVCRNTVKAAEHETDAVRRGVGSLQGQMEEFKAKIGSDVFGVEAEKSEVKVALDQAKAGVKKTMDRLTGWRMLWKVDDIADTVNASIDRSWCRDLENKLIFQVGRLSVTQNFLTGAANALLSSFPKPSTFHSLILQNTLAQLRVQPSFAVHPSSLTLPIYTRRTQLTYPTNALHQSAQRAVVGMGGSVLSGMGVAWAGWADQLELLGHFSLGVGAETAAGLGMFTAVAGIWYSIGRWEKAKRRWWRDWDRVGEGLERDLRATLNQVVADQVLVVPTTACENLRDMIKKREDEVAQLKDEITILEQDCVRR
ncbi:hypothetical protein BXZ70DRAFT_1003420 [Cristinia sonorae]|uniref:Mmc1 C-terminal domain-containing protein n=1 Tax=Cristinia sonorae TaxID=1940300 RepID=A0A8K0XUS4_9AGAR|nr:hypothetical protein BXZ70DRAFT_1003420 [Cristinia sonorae]